MAQFLFRANYSHASATTTRRCFYDYRVTNLAGEFQPLCFRFNSLGTSRQYRQSRLRHCSPSLNLVAHQTDHSRLWPNELDVARFANFGEVSRLSKEPVPRMDRVDVKDFRSTDNCRDIQVTLRRGSRSNTRGFISKSDMQRIAVNIAVNRNRLDAHLFARPNNPTCYLTAVSDQDFFEFAVG